jgi:hypothetical protein
MTAAEVTSALSTRKAVRVTFSRKTLLHRVDLMVGDTVTDTIVITANEDLAEGYAQSAARILGLDVTRLDVD